MTAVGEILRRFRFHGVPGAPAPAGVPVDRASLIEAELAPVFSSLEAAHLRAAELTEDAAARAAGRRLEAVEQAGQILVRARDDADAARAESAARRLERAEIERRQLVEDARTEAERVAKCSAERMPVLVEEIVRRVLAMAQAPASPGISAPMGPGASHTADPRAGAPSDPGALRTSDPRAANTGNHGT